MKTAVLTGEKLDNTAVFIVSNIDEESKATANGEDKRHRTNILMTVLFFRCKGGGIEKPEEKRAPKESINIL